MCCADSRVNRGSRRMRGENVGERRDQRTLEEWCACVRACGTMVRTTMIMIPWTLKECDAFVYHTIESDLPSASTSSILQGSSEWVHVVH